MRLFELTLMATALLSGCIIVGEMPKGTWGDTGAFEVETEEEAETVQVIVTPNQLTMGTVEDFMITVEPAIEYELVSDVIALNGAEILRFKPIEGGLVASITAPEDVEPGPVTILLEYADGSVEIGKEALTLIDPNAELEEGDTGQAEDETPE